MPQLPMPPHNVNLNDQLKHLANDINKISQYENMIRAQQQQQQQLEMSNAAAAAAAAMNLFKTPNPFMPIPFMSEEEKFHRLLLEFQQQQNQQKK